MTLSLQITYLFLLALPIACIAWTVTHEEVFKEPREYCEKKSKECRSLVKKKFFYLFTCEYCFSHYVTIVFLFITKFRLLYDGWVGYLISGFALVWIANFYMSLFARVRVTLKKERAAAELQEKELKEVKEGTRL